MFGIENYLGFVMAAILVNVTPGTDSMYIIYSNSMMSFLVLGLTFASTGFIWCSYLALLASKFSENLRKNPTIEVILHRISGVIFIGMGVKLLTEKG
jgi:threonine/homoserine/homoserine lactone efflux protein